MVEKKVLVMWVVVVLVLLVGGSDCLIRTGKHLPFLVCVLFFFCQF
jgi:hypothetical protein